MRLDNGATIPSTQATDAEVTAAIAAHAALAGAHPYSGISGVAYTQYTPTVTQGGAVSTFTNNSCWYVQIGKYVHAYGYLNINNAGAAAGANNITVTLPVNGKYSSSLAYIIGEAELFDFSADDIYGAHARMVSASTFSLLPTGADLLATTQLYLGNVTPFTAALASTDVLEWNIMYEAA